MDKTGLLASIDSIDKLGIIFCVVAAIGAVGLVYVAVDHWRLGNQLQAIEADEQRTHEATIASVKADAEKTAERVAEANERARLSEAKPRGLLDPVLLPAVVDFSRQPIRPQAF